MIFKRLVLLTSLFALSGCEGKSEAWYQNVLAENEWDETQGVIKSLASDADVPPYIIENGRLLVNIQNTRHNLFYTEVSHPVWNEKKIAMLKEKDTTFRENLPNADDPLGGIRWLAR